MGLLATSTSSAREASPACSCSAAATPGSNTFGSKGSRPSAGATCASASGTSSWTAQVTRLVLLRLNNRCERSSSTSRYDSTRLVGLTICRVRFVSPNGRAAVDAEGGRPTLSTVFLRSDPLNFGETTTCSGLWARAEGNLFCVSTDSLFSNQAVNQDVRTSDYDGMLRAVVRDLACRTRPQIMN
jgi:hypothetical protein